MPQQARRTSLARRFLATLATAALGACALLPFEPDRAARAPALEGFGHIEMAITTPSTAARRWFEQGVAQAYAFNEVEAVRAFKAALAQDPGCAMCAWGVAWQLGPNINAVERGDLTEALRNVGHALLHAPAVSARERALIEAMALRYAHASQARAVVASNATLSAEVCRSGGGSGDADDEKPHPLDVAYAERMRTLADADPADADMLSLYAEAELVATRSDWWNLATGQPAGRIGEVVARLERALVQQPGHTGLNHYLIHAADALPAAHRAVAAADRLGALAPMSPHLLHMPSHTYVHVGRYADATRVNQQAIAADMALADAQKTQGFSVSKDWRGHNVRFQWFAALMEGRGELALATARRSAERAAKAAGPWGDYARSLPLVTLVRLERWDAVLSEPVPSGKGLDVVLAEQARGVALLRAGRIPEAQLAATRLEGLAATLKKGHASKSYTDKMVRGMVGVAAHRLQAELALAAQRPDDAMVQQAQAITAAKDIDASEPPMLAAGTRLALGGMQLQAQRWADAEKSFRQDLTEHPGSGWAMRGLALALQGQGRSAEMAAQRAELDRVWALADPALHQRR